MTGYLVKTSYVNHREDQIVRRIVWIGIDRRTSSRLIPTSNATWNQDENEIPWTRVVYVLLLTPFRTSSEVVCYTQRRQRRINTSLEGALYLTDVGQMFSQKLGP